MEKEILHELIERGFTLKQIAKECGTSQTNARYWIKKFGLKLKRGARGKKPKDFQFPRKCSCGETDPTKFYGNKTTKCGKCHNKLMHQKGKDNRKYMIDKLGGKCFNCGFNMWLSSLDVHHLDSKIKDSAFRTARYWSIERLDKELENCVLLCRNCHAAHHSGELINMALSSNG